MPAAALERLAEADAYRSLGLDRRQGVWQVKGLADSMPPLFAAADVRRRPGAGHCRSSSIVLVWQKPGSARDVMFITIEDKTGVANLILWPDRCERQRRLVLSPGMIACHGKIQREGAVTHVITDRLEDLYELLRSIGQLDAAFPIEHGRGDEAQHSIGLDPHQASGTDSRPVRDIYVPDLRIGSGIKVPTRDFR